MDVSALLSAGGQAATAATNLVGSAFISKANRKSQERINQANIDNTNAANEAQRRWEREQMDYENKINKEWWDMQNAYNSPAAQVARMREAGLNPALLYGSAPSNTASELSSASGGAARNAIPDLTAPHYDQIPIGSLGGALLQASQFALQKKLNDAQVEKLVADTAKTWASVPTDIPAARDLVDRGLKSAQFKLEQEGNVESARYNLYQQQSANNPRKFDDEHALNVAEIARKIADTEYYGLRKKLVDSQLRSADMQRVLMGIEIDLRNKGVNPNDPGWYKDVKKVIEPLLQKWAGSSSHDTWNYGTPKHGR